MKKNSLISLLLICTFATTHAISIRSHHGPTELPAGSIIIKEHLYFYPISVTVRPRGNKQQTVTVTMRVGSDFELKKGFNWPSNWIIGSENRYYFNLVSQDKEIRPIAQTNVRSVVDSGTSSNIDIIFAIGNDINIRDFSIRFVGRNKKERATYEESIPLAPFIRT
jgi:hypothetical protein